MPRATAPDRVSAGSNRVIALTVAGVVLAFLIMAFVGGADDEGASGEIVTSPSGYDYQVGEPGPGSEAPNFSLPATTGDFELSELDGQRVLLYFQEGLMCQPCWDQLTEIEQRWDEFEALGIDAIVSVTTDELDPLEQKVALEGITTPVVADASRAVSDDYNTLDYGMMGGSHNGHTFLIVEPDGAIEWRADYGGAPDYTMYLPVDALLTDLAAPQDPAA